MAAVSVKRSIERTPYALICFIWGTNCRMACMYERGVNLPDQYSDRFDQLVSTAGVYIENRWIHPGTPKLASVKINSSFIYLQQRISSNNSRGRLCLLSHREGAIIRGKRLYFSQEEAKACDDFAVGLYKDGKDSSGGSDGSLGMYLLNYPILNAEASNEGHADVIGKRTALENGLAVSAIYSLRASLVV